MDGNGDYTCPPHRDIQRSPTGLALWEKEKSGQQGWHSSQLRKWGDLAITPTHLRRADGVGRGNDSAGFILSPPPFLCVCVCECLCVCQPASMFLFYFLLALHESRKPSPTQKVRSRLMRIERYLPALTTPVMRYALEPLTGG